MLLTIRCGHIGQTNVFVPFPPRDDAVVEADVRNASALFVHFEGCPSLGRDIETARIFIRR